MRPKTRQIKRGIPLLFALAGAMFAACGGSTVPGVASLGHHARGSSTTGSGRSTGSSNSGGSGPSGATVGIGGATLKFASCMRSHGFPNFPDPNGQGEISVNVDPNSARFQAAQQACAKYSGASGKPPSPAQQEKFLANALRFSACMRAHGVSNFPDPTTGPNGQGIALKIGRGLGVNPNSTVFQKAEKACQGNGRMFSAKAVPVR